MVNCLVFPRFGGHLKIGTMMYLEVFYLEEKTVSAVQLGVNNRETLAFGQGCAEASG
jgi:hypothetical protein